MGRLSNPSVFDHDNRPVTCPMPRKLAIETTLKKTFIRAGIMQKINKI